MDGKFSGWRMMDGGRSRGERSQGGSWKRTALKLGVSVTEKDIDFKTYRETLGG